MSPWRQAGRRARHHLGLQIGLGIFLFVILVAVFANQLAPHDPYAQNLAHRLLPPVWDTKGVWDHPLGTDGFGRDYLSRLMLGGRVSVLVGVMVALISGVIGVTLGLLAGYFGGRVDWIVMYIINTRLSMPVLLVALVVASIMGSSLTMVVLVLGFLNWDRFAVVTRTTVQQIASQDFVNVARSIGCSTPRILFSEVLPNALGQIIVVATLEMASAVLIEAGLSFLGLGIQPPTPSWGTMVAEARNYMFFNPYLITIPGTAIFMLVVAINLLGDGVRDVMMPEGRN